MQLFGPRLAKGMRADLRTRAAGLRRAKLRPADLFRGRSYSKNIDKSGSPISTILTASPQPSGGACDAEEQPSARGRLRAAGPDGPILQTIVPPK